MRINCAHVQIECVLMLRSAFWHGGLAAEIMAGANSGTGTLSRLSPLACAYGMIGLSEGTYAGFERPECIGEPHRGQVRPNVEASMKIHNLHRLSPLPRRPVKQPETCKMRVFYRLIGKG